MVLELTDGCYHRLNGHEFELAPGDGEGKESLACCSLWGRRELDTTDQRNNNKYEPLRVKSGPRRPGEIKITLRNLVFFQIKNMIPPPPRTCPALGLSAVPPTAEG